MNTIKLKPVAPTYGVKEEMKNLRTNLLFSGADLKVIMLTSCVSGEGKSETAYNLARSLTELGKKVLLIDTDMRKSAMIRILENGSVDKGLSHYLSGQSHINDVVNRTNVPGLHIIFAGRAVPNPVELFSKNVFSKTIESLRNVYDYIVIDTPPLGMVVDAAVISQVCDASALVLESGTIKRKFAQKTVAKLEALDCPLLGVVLNKVDRKKTGEYYGKAYQKYYGKKYE
ncbi:capsular exopolysaccharide synthesis family protein [Lachnospiraceae bacterium PM6-15]|uniref:polysaccharide biosynthesis tyrosine autokinase n=1 Tax=Ohessyouella blattaphilus TaxID=2949333 RepID=UPI003E216DE8